jgi:hypothetical protein
MARPEGGLLQFFAVGKSRSNSPLSSNCRNRVKETVPYSKSTHLTGIGYAEFSFIAAEEGGAEVAVNLLGGGEQTTGERCGNGNQNSGSRQILRAGKHREGIVEQSHSRQEAIHRAIQRSAVEALRRRRGGKWRPRRSRQWHSGGRNLDDWIPRSRSRGRVYFGSTHFQLEGKRERERTWFGARVPTQPTESLADGCFAETKPARNPSINPFFGLEAEDGPVSRGDFFGAGVRAGGVLAVAPRHAVLPLAGAVGNDEEFVSSSRRSEQYRSDPHIRIRTASP